ADETVREMIKESGVELEYLPIGRDALVFIANDGNPIINLTEKQIQDIYQGKTTNWKGLGGEDREIVAYQRSQDSGSQALMDKLVMKGLTPADAPVELYPGTMGGLIEAIAEYSNSKNAIGYSVYYYVSNMYSLPGLRLMSVNGVVPSNGTIADGTYPYTNEFFAVIRKNEPKDGDTRKLLDWVLSAEGKQAVIDAGYVGV
ncbi:MAG: substrate-binding domain-containing protein, partial [Oscillospiraceae bacterium]|nr:substrate-binding domain-containing protein [Oscillospiraceae bacterium]